jgi:hypothetical protein
MLSVITVMTQNVTTTARSPTTFNTFDTGTVSSIMSKL